MEHSAKCKLQVSVRVDDDFQKFLLVIPDSRITIRQLRSHIDQRVDRLYHSTDL